MADAITKVAPLSTEEGLVDIAGQKVKKSSKEHLALSKVYDQSRKYVYELAVKNPERELPVMNARTNRPSQVQEYKPYQNIVLTSQIVWNGKRRMIRYYDGCDSVFVDEQPKEKEILDQYIKQTKRREFLEGKFSCWGYEAMLLFYLDICSWNADSSFRTNSASAVFINTDREAKLVAENAKLDAAEQALKLAKAATEQKMRIHAAYLGLDLMDWDASVELTELQVRSLYRKEALNNPDKFIESYGNKTIEVKYWIDKALEKGVISNKFNPNKATWGTNNTVICDISGLKSNDAISQAIYEFSQSQEGEEFLIQLKNISESL